ncbi:LytS/YhcK type 5TM receptor domain-containing protein [Citreimonas salinaria]|uniref:Diguanylate cyclase n=1 Tax=Citreimonas salinaria TaxID=321339 RepID=A0A1H3HXA4_9RHOB|nr:LytS/YhcK type 5TM receptor domain-containing protein [Citreimonas salinaria]SDY19855.1 diguanylate cyclase [Citreimonas salinaria]
MIEYPFLAGWAGLLAPLFVVAAGYGRYARAPGERRLLQLGAGCAFGAVAVLLMAMPLRIADGVIVDMRAVPVALAAAFLGLRGGAVALFMAIAMRLWIGGIGTGAGIAALLFGAIAGFAWSQETRPAERSARDYLQLAAMVSLGLWTIVLLPTQAAIGVLTAALPLVLLNMLVLPPAAFLLDGARMPPVPRRLRATL